MGGGAKRLGDSQVVLKLLLSRVGRKSRLGTRDKGVEFWEGIEDEDARERKR